jgi:hypothetical protein
MTSPFGFTKGTTLMNQPTSLKTTTLSVRNPISRSPLWRTLSLSLVALVCFGLLPTGQAKLLNPKPDGGYPGNNTAEGTGALSNVQINTTNGNGVADTAIGFDALTSNTTGYDNTATGAFALTNNTTGPGNTAIGFAALNANTTGSENTAIGNQVLFRNTTGINNTASGAGALISNTTGSDNMANGIDALVNNTTGNNNTADGFEALLNNKTGGSNIGLGNGAGSNLTTGSNNIDIFDPGVAGESNTIRIGTQGTQTTTFIAGIYGETTGSATTLSVIVDSNGQLGTTASSERFKKDIKPIDKTSEAILELKPVTFHYKSDTKGIPQFGLVAEQVEKVDPDLVARDADGKVYTVRYEAVNAMLLNEFLKEHKKVEQLEATAARQQREIDTLTAGLQKVSAQVELKQPSPQMAINSP